MVIAGSSSSSAGATGTRNMTDKIVSWMHNEDRCVTTQRVSQCLNVSRKRASELLSGLLFNATPPGGRTDHVKGTGSGSGSGEDDNDNHKKYRVTVCQSSTTTNDEAEVEDRVPLTVFRLKSSLSIQGHPYQDDDVDDDKVDEPCTRRMSRPHRECIIMALAPLSCPDTLVNAHERDLLEWRERVADGRSSQAVMDTDIEPADAIALLKDSDPASRTSTTTTATSTTSTTMSNRYPPNSHKAFSGKQTVTTAASFFGSTHATTTTTTIKKTPPQPTAAKENKIRSTNQVAPAPSSSSSSKKNTSPTKQIQDPRPPPNPRTQTSTKGGGSSVNVGVGNADDFVADEEDSDDDEEPKDDFDQTTNKEPKKKQRQQQKKKDHQTEIRKAVKEANHQASMAAANTTSTTELDGGEDIVEKYRVVGAMDAFTTTTTTMTPKTMGEGPSPLLNHGGSSITTTNPATGRQRKRRKKLVEETVMVNGYLRTETKAIWEDVPTDEEEEETKMALATKRNQQAKTLLAAKNAQGMKQKSLMGFFAKKK